MKKILIAIVAVSLLSAAMIGVFCLRSEWEQLRASKFSKRVSGKTADEIRFDEDFNSFYGIEPFETDLPILYIDTNGEAIFHDEKIMARLSILNAANDGSVHLSTETPDVSLDIKIKKRGASSKNFDKAQYRIEFTKDATGSKEINYDLLQMGKASEWVLNGPFLDKSLARNYLAYGLGAEIMEWTPECRYIELFLNGQYQGVYLALEPVTNGESRLRLSKFGLLSGEAAYILHRDRIGADINAIENYGKTAGYTSNDLYIQYPGTDKITENEYRWITEDVSRFERALYGDDYRDPLLGYAAYIDVGNFVDYYLINELFMNHDAGYLSTYVYKEMGDKLKLVMWDYNNGLDNYQGFREEFDWFYVASVPWYDRLITDRNFVDRLVERYAELRKSTFSQEHIFGILDGTAEILGDAIERNFKVWGFSFKLNMLVGDRDIKSYDEAMAQLKEAITKRLAFMDEHLEDLYGNCV